MIIDINVRPGELIGEDGILELAQVSRMFAIAEVYETDIRHVKPGSAPPSAVRRWTRN